MKNNPGKQAEKKAKTSCAEVRPISHRLRVYVLDALKRIESKIVSVRGTIHSGDASLLSSIKAEIREALADANGIQKIVERRIAHSRAMSAGHDRRRYLDRLFAEEQALRGISAPRKILIYLRSKGTKSSTKAEIRNQVFYGCKLEAEIKAWLRELHAQGLAYCIKEIADGGDVVEKWFATEQPNEQ